MRRHDQDQTPAVGGSLRVPSLRCAATPCLRDRQLHSPANAHLSLSVVSYDGIRAGGNTREVGDLGRHRYKVGLTITGDEEEVLLSQFFAVVMDFVPAVAVTFCERFLNVIDPGVLVSAGGHPRRGGQRYVDLHNGSRHVVYLFRRSSTRRHVLARKICGSADAGTNRRLPTPNEHGGALSDQPRDLLEREDERPYVDRRVDRPAPTGSPPMP